VSSPNRLAEIQSRLERIQSAPLWESDKKKSRDCKRLLRERAKLLRDLTKYPW